MPTAEKVRDAERSREAILAAAERFFAHNDYGKATLGDIAAAAGLSRGTPAYFFGSKENLYLYVLDRVFEARQEATHAAFEPVRAWCEGGGGPDALRAALTRAADGYLGFLLDRPTFAPLIMREELAGGVRLRRRRASSTAVEDAFAAVRAAGRGRGLRSFKVDDAVLLFVSLTFAPASYRATLMRSVGRDLSEPAGRRRQVKLAVDQVMRLVAE